MKILGIIPARGGSKGIPEKNIKLLGNKPLLEYTWDAVKDSKLLKRVILSSDSSKIIEVARNLNIEVPFVRPKEISTDDTPSIKVIDHAINFFANLGENFDAVCLLQPTSPFRNKEMIDEAIKEFESGNFDSLISVRQIPEEFNPQWIFEEKNGSLRLVTGKKKIIPRRQDLPKAYHRDGALYLIKTKTIIDNKSLYGESIGYIDTTGNDYVNIDTPEDWIKAEKILNRRNKFT